MTVHYGLDELPAAPSQVTPEAAGIPDGAPLAPRRRPPDRAEGSRDAAARVRPRPRAASGRAARDPRERPARGERRARSCTSSGSDDAVVLPGRHGDPRLARARGRLRPHLALGGVRDRPARGDARRACRSSRRASAPCRRSSSTARRGSSSARATSTRSPQRSTSCSPIRTRARASATAGLAASAERVLGRADDRADARRLPAESRLRQQRPFRRLLTGPQPDPDRIFFTSIWFKGHNNPRYAELLPRLTRLDGYLATASGERIPRGLQYRAFRWSARVRNPARLRAREPALLDDVHRRQRADPALRGADRRRRRRSALHGRARSSCCGTRT